MTDKARFSRAPESRSGLVPVALAALVAAALVLTIGVVVTGSRSPSREEDQEGPAGRSSTVTVGVLNPHVRSPSALASAGLTAVHLQVAWDLAQPAPGELNEQYLGEVRATYRRYRDAGLGVVLDPGLQYPPSWVVDVPGARFVNQYGQAYGAPADSGRNVADAVFDDDVRRAQADYISRLGDALGRGSFRAVRLGGLFSGELRYPDADHEGRSGSWWAFSPAAQRKSPVPGYRPGVSVPDAGAEAAFLDFYLGSMADYQSFLHRTLAASFSGDVHVLYPSYGARPGDRERALAAGLAQDSLRRNELIQGVDLPRLVGLLPGYQASRSSGRLVAYTTWLDGPEFGTDDAGVTPVEYLARLTASSSVAVGGENTMSSADDPAVLALCQERAGRLGLRAIMWFNRPSTPDAMLVQLGRSAVQQPAPAPAPAPAREFKGLNPFTQ